MEQQRRRAAANAGHFSGDLCSMKMVKNNVLIFAASFFLLISFNNLKEEKEISSCLCGCGLIRFVISFWWKYVTSAIFNSASPTSNKWDEHRRKIWKLFCDKPKLSYFWQTLVCSCWIPSLILRSWLETFVFRAFYNWCQFHNQIQCWLGMFPTVHLLCLPSHWTASL